MYINKANIVPTYSAESYFEIEFIENVDIAHGQLKAKKNLTLNVMQYHASGKYHTVSNNPDTRYVKSDRV
jgi:hypothetical protein